MKRVLTLLFVVLALVASACGAATESETEGAPSGDSKSLSLQI